MTARIEATLRLLAERGRSGDHSGMAQVELDLGPGATGGLLSAAPSLPGSPGTWRRSSRAAPAVRAARGEAGVGKTVLVEALRAAHPGLTVVRGECEPLFAPPPLGPLLEAAGEVGGTLKALVDDGAMPHEIAAALLAALGSRATILVLEDLHWADEATLDVFRLLARRIETVPCLLVATYRDEALGGADRLRIVLGELATARSVDRNATGGAVGSGGRGALRAVRPRRSRALPQDERQPVLRRRGAGRRFRSDSRDGPGRRARSRSPVEPRGPGAPGCGCVTPPSTELWLLRALAPEQEEHLDECLASGMLRSEPRGVAFRHDLARMAVEEEVAPLRREELHRRALAALADPPSGGVDLARVAHHAEAADDADAVLRYAPAAAMRAASLGAHREAARSMRGRCATETSSRRVSGPSCSSAARESAT